ncbi:MAG TPA: ABC transporter substrate-binding protein [Candidatus Cybelea sp.]|nr:ABC transporter substrate-binding protein [Candidatus Cybelea sp.]
MFRRATLLLAALVAVGSLAAAAAQAADAIRIGFAIAQTGGLAGTGKATPLATQMWAEDVNAKGGLLGRKVELVVYDDQSNPAAVPGIHIKLIDVDKVELVVSGYATNMVVPAMPIIMQRGLLFMGLFGVAINDLAQFKHAGKQVVLYPKEYKSGNFK